VSGLPALRRPVVLVHGLLGFSRFAVRDVTLARYFRGVPERLAAAGIRTHAPALPPTGSIARRAEALAKAVRAIPGRGKVHVVAHSMGGLDARHALAHLGIARRVLSLTTIGTPHRGTPVADRGTGLADRFGVLDGLTSAGFVTEAFRDLRRDACAAFNAATPDAPGVLYASFAGRKRRADTAAALRWTHDVIASSEGANDGLVSVASAQWGTRSEVVVADHLDLVGWTPVVSSPFGRAVDVAALWDRFLVPAADAEREHAGGRRRGSGSA